VDHGHSVAVDSQASATPAADSAAAAGEGARARPLVMLGWVALAVAGGLLWSREFGPRGFRVEPWVALVPLLLLLGSPRPKLLGFLHGVVFWVGSMPWIASTLVTYGGIAPALAWVLLVLLAAYLALFWVAFAGLGARFWRQRALLALVALPALWVVLELVRGWLFSGYPWNLAAYAWVEVPGALPLSSWIGPWGVSYLVLLANAGVALGIARRNWRVALLAVLTPLLLLASAGRFAHGAARAGAGQSVRVLQPNIANLAHYEQVAALRNYEHVLAMSRAACDETGALVIWPESAGWPFQYPEDVQFARDLHGLAARGCPVLFNTAFREGKAWHNAAFLLTPEGVESRYDKRHLVPFGEYVPLKGVFGFMDTLAREAGDFAPATVARLLPWAHEQLGVAICFEITFPGEVAEVVRKGATTLVTITNDAWYGDSDAPWQHFRAARFRAAESRRPLLRAAITGVSALVRADGSLAGELGPFEEGVLRGDVVGGVGLSPYTAHPYAVPVLCWLLLAGALVAAVGLPGPAARSATIRP